MAPASTNYCSHLSHTQLSATTTPQPLLIAQQNLGRGIDATSHLIKLNEQRHFDIILLQEPYCIGSSIAGLPLRASVCYAASSRPKTAIFTTKVRTVQLFLLSTVSSETQTVCLVQTPQDTFYAISAYWPPRQRIEPHISELETALSSLPRGAKVIIGVDANAHSLAWGLDAPDARGSQVEEAIGRNNLDFLNHGSTPTFYTVSDSGIKQSFVDLTLVSPPFLRRSRSWEVICDSVSDHRLLLSTFSRDPVREERPPTTKRFNTNRADWVKFRRNFASSIDTHTDGTTEELANTTLEALSASAYASIPARKPTSDTHTVPWWTPELTDKRATLRKCQNDYERLRSGSFINISALEAKRQRFLAARTEYRNTIRRSKRKCWSDYLKANLEDDPWGLPYKLAKSAPTRSTLASLKRPDGSFTTTPGESVELLLSTFFPRAEGMHADTSACVPPSTADDPPFTDTEVRAAIASMSKKKAPGKDGITADILLEAFEAAPEHFTAVFNRCLKEGIFPAAYKEAVVRLINKPNKTDLSDPKSYRPICLLPTIGKALESLMINRVLDHELRNGLLHPHQYGFLPQRSTEDALHAITSWAREAKTNDQHALIVGLDISGAFDNASWPLILNTLNKHGCPRNIYNLVASFLSGRKCELSVGYETRTRELNLGCPQGSRASPTLWAVLFDNLLRTELPPGAQIIAFADDTTLLVQHSNLVGTDSVESIANEALSRIAAWAQTSGLTFNAAKSAAVLHSRHSNVPSKPKPTLVMNGEPIAIRPFMKLLGVTIDQNLTGNQHVFDLKKRVRKVANQLVAYTRKTIGTDREYLRTLYLNAIEPMITYAASIWWRAATTKWHSTTLNSLQRIVTLRICYGYSTTSTAACQTLADLMPLNLRVQEEACRYFALRAKLPPPKDATVRFGDLLEQCGNAEKPLSTIDIGPPHTQLAISHSATTIDECELSIFTDGSRIPDIGVGASFVAYDRSNVIIHHRQLRLAPHCSIFQAEALAIAEALAWCATIHTPLHIAVNSDSLSSCLALRDPRNKHPLINRAKQHWREASALHRLELHWVRAHIGIEGNEEADRLAKEAAADHSLPISYDAKPPTALKALIRQHFINRWDESWQTSQVSDNGQPKLVLRFFPTITARRSCKFYRPDPLTTQFITGHGDFRAYLHRFARLDRQTQATYEPTCPLCSHFSDDPLHRLFACPAYTRERTRALSLTAATELNPHKFLNSAASLAIFRRFCSQIATAATFHGISTELTPQEADPGALVQPERAAPVQ